ncbi:MAG: hypothetical protein GY859_43730, partial [Desulfobacterales bacterium]|nr:hypothetical protein [Desulfobacterales bacterium]
MGDDKARKTAATKSGDERIFEIPPGSDASRLAHALAQWLEAEQDRACAVEAIEGGWLIQARDAGGMLKKLAARKADHLHVILKPGDGRLVVRFSHG